MPVGDQVGPDQLPDELEEEAAVEAGQLGGPRLPVVAQPVPVGDGHQEEVEGGGLGGETREMPFPDQASVDPGEADPAGSGQSADPVGKDRAMPVSQPAFSARSR